MLLILKIEMMMIEMTIKMMMMIEMTFMMMIAMVVMMMMMIEMTIMIMIILMYVNIDHDDYDDDENNVYHK